MDFSTERHLSKPTPKSTYFIRIFAWLLFMCVLASPLILSIFHLKIKSNSPDHLDQEELMTLLNNMEEDTYNPSLSNVDREGIKLARIGLFDNWLREKVTLNITIHNFYTRTYLEGDLEAMAKQGDTNAAEALDRLYFSRSEQIKVPEIANNCISLGSLSCIYDMAIYYSPIIQFQTEPLKEIRAKVIKAFAFYRLLDIRGGSKTFKTDSIRQIFENELMKWYRYRLTDLDKAEIDTMALQLYNHYQSERNQLGLGDFKNIANFN